MEVWGGGGEQVVRTSKDLKIYIYIYISIKEKLYIASW